MSVKLVVPLEEDIQDAKRLSLIERISSLDGVKKVSVDAAESVTASMSCYHGTPLNKKCHLCHERGKNLSR